MSQHDTESKPDLQFPSEIVHKILTFTCSGILYDKIYIYPIWREVDDSNEKPKKGLSSCSLVCRHWAMTVRVGLFSRLILRSAEDLDMLFMFMNSSAAAGRPISHLIEMIRIDLDTESQRPWLHHLHKPSKCINLAGAPFHVRYELRIIGSTTTALQAKHILPSHSLPRSHPHMRPRIDVLSLEGLNFHQASDLFLLICGFRGMEHCSMKCVTFLTPSAPPLSNTTIAASRYEFAKSPWFQAWAEKCGNNMASTQLALRVAMFSALVWLRFDNDTWDIVCQAVLSYTPGNHLCAGIATHSARGVLEILTSDSISSRQEALFRTSIRISDGILWDARPAVLTSLTASFILSWDLYLNENIDDIQAIDWELFQKTLLYLSPTPSLIIESPRENIVRWLVQAIMGGSILGPMLKAGKLELVWWDIRPSLRRVNILAPRAEYSIDGSMVVLNFVEHFELLLRKNNPPKYGEPESYLRTLLQKQGNENQSVGEVINPC